MPVEKRAVDEQIAALGGFHSWFTWKERGYLHNVMASGEKIFAMTSGFLEGNTWLVTVTDKRVLFLNKGLVYGLKQMELSLSHISSVAYKTGLIFGRIQFSAAGGTKRIEMVRKNDVSKVAHIISGLIAKLKIPAHAGAATDLISQLERLAALKLGGILTDEELARQKAKILQAA
jgi:hypothetical protein